jgi:hypothetical protein
MQKEPVVLITVGPKKKPGSYYKWGNFKGARPIVRDHAPYFRSTCIRRLGVPQHQSLLSKNSIKKAFYSYI